MTSYKTYRCHACGRRLSKAAYTSPEGWVLGPVCALNSTALPEVPRPKNINPKKDSCSKPRRTRPTKMRKARKRRQRAPSPMVLPGQMVLDLGPDHAATFGDMIVSRGSPEF